MHLIIIIIGRLRSPTDAAACPMARSSSVDISMWRLYQRDAEGSIAYITSWQISSQHVIVATANLARWNVRAVTSEVTLWRQRWRTVELWVGVTCNWIDQRARSLARSPTGVRCILYYMSGLHCAANASDDTTSRRNKNVHVIIPFKGEKLITREKSDFFIDFMLLSSCKHEVLGLPIHSEDEKNDMSIYPFHSRKIHIPASLKRVIVIIMAVMAMYMHKSHYILPFRTP